MPNITLTFEKDINTSAQVGDMAYFSPTSSSAEFTVSDEIKALGKIKKITQLENGNWVMVCNMINIYNFPNVTNSFITFSKDRVVNTSSVLGYYAKVRIENSSKVKGEMFSIGCDVIQSSK